MTTLIFSQNDHAIDQQRAPLVFCFVLSSNDRHLTSSRAVVYSWGKRCDRFYFITRLQNTSIDLMMLPKFENSTDINSTTINQYTLDVLLHLRNEELAASSHWFLRGSEDTFVIVPNLRRLVTQLDREENHHPFAYVGDVEELYDKHQISTSGSVMLFNRNALDRLHQFDFQDDKNRMDIQKEQCFEKMIYDHEFVKCIKQIEININPVNDNLIFSQDLARYKMDKRLKVM